jgi:hypothetical protein
MRADAERTKQLASRRDWPSSLLAVSGWLALAGVVGWWVSVLERVIRHAVFVSHDTLISYAHVWYIADRLWHGHGLPYRMPILHHGQALAFPYGLVPWATAALVRPLFGDWVVTLWLVVGTVGLMAATLWAFPELRRGWWAAAALVNPALVSSPIIGQLPFVWAAMLLLVAVGAWRRDRRTLATVAAALAQVTHPAVVFPLTAAVVVARLSWEPDRRALLRSYAWTLPFVAVAVAMTLSSPVFNDTTLREEVTTFVGTIAPRCLIIVVPVALVLVRRLPWQWTGAGIAALLVAANVAMGPSLGMPWAWGALKRTPDPRMLQFTSSAAFTPGAEYRVLRIADGKVGMYQVLRAGGRLDSEFFPESISRDSWPDPAIYSRFLRQRGVDFVMLWRGYDRRYATNEHALLDRLAAAPRCDRDVVEVHLDQHAENYDVYRVRRDCS